MILLMITWSWWTGMMSEVVVSKSVCLLLWDVDRSLCL